MAQIGLRTAQWARMGRNETEWRERDGWGETALARGHGRAKRNTDAAIGVGPTSQHQNTLAYARVYSALLTLHNLYKRIYIGGYGGMEV